MSAPLTTPDGADARLAALDGADQVIARRALLRLINVEDRTPGAPQALSVLCACDDGERVAAVLRGLAEAGVVAITGDPADPRVALDADALSGPTLATWIRKRGKAEQLRRQLESDAADWQSRPEQRAGDGLLDKPRLRELDAWFSDDARRELGMTATAEALLAASRAAARRRWWPSKNAIGSVLAVGLILMLLATPIVLLFIVVLTAWVIHHVR